MNTNDQKKFQANYVWFNHFFGDLKQLLDAISNRLISDLGMEKSDRGWYYEKLNNQPTMPPYYLAALGNKEFVVQVFVVLDTTLLPEQSTFTNQEPSLIIVKHSRAGRVLWPGDYGLKIIRNKQITLDQLTDKKVIGGKFLAGDAKGAQYFAFQVLLDHFALGKDINAAIRTEIIDVLRELPDWEKN